MLAFELAESVLKEVRRVWKEGKTFDEKVRNAYSSIRKQGYISLGERAVKSAPKKEEKKRSSLHNLSDDDAKAMGQQEFERLRERDGAKRF